MIWYFLGSFLAFMVGLLWGDIRGTRRVWINLGSPYGVRDAISARKVFDAHVEKTVSRVLATPVDDQVLMLLGDRIKVGDPIPKELMQVIKYTIDRHEALIDASIKDFKAYAELAGRVRR